MIETWDYKQSLSQLAREKVIKKVDFVANDGRNTSLTGPEPFCGSSISHAVVYALLETLLNRRVRTEAINNFCLAFHQKAKHLLHLNKKALQTEVPTKYIGSWDR